MEPRRASTRLRTTASLGLALATFLWPLFGPPQATAQALWPSLLAITLAFATRDIYLSLFTGALAGAILLNGGNPALGFLDLFADFLRPRLTDPWNVNVLIFTLLMGGLVELLERGGGMAAAADRLLGGARDSKRAGLAVYGLGWLFFLDGLANSMLLGKALRPLADRARLSPQKLAFLVDSTASPIAGLALISTWVAYELSLIRDAFAGLGRPDISAFAILVQSLPYRFYSLFMLALVFFVVWLGRDLGPMLAAERAARRQERSSDAADEHTARAAIAPAIVPLVLLIVAVVVGLYLDGGGSLRALDLDSAIAALGAADAAQVFVWATAIASLVAIAMLLPGAPAGREPPVRIFFDGLGRMFLPALILVFAWTLNAVTSELGAAPYLAGLLGEQLPPGLLPAVVFVLGALVSFSTGTSWGTMAVVMPLVVPIAAALDDAGSDPSHITFAAIGAVLAGAVFGDHCSPISDTTLVASVSTGCDPMDHVRTQLPYALGVATIALVAGYLPTGFGLAPWIALPLGAALCWAWLRFWGRSPAP